MAGLDAIDRACLACGGSLDDKQSNAIYCSRRCLGRMAMRRRRAEKHDAVLGAERLWRRANVVHIRARERAYWCRNGEHINRQRRARRVGLTVEGYDRIWAEQDGRCGICRVDLLPLGRTARGAVVDHDHETGRVRGLLCNSCNRGVGLLGDSLQVLRAALVWLDEA